MPNLRLEIVKMVNSIWGHNLTLFHDALAEAYVPALTSSTLGMDRAA